MNPNLHNILNTARYYCQTGLYQQAEPILTNLAAKPECVPAAVPLLANIYCATARIPEAIALLEDARLKHPGVVELDLALGAAYQTSGDFEAAEESYRKALRADPGSTAAHTNLAALLLAADRPLDAEQYARRAVELDGASYALITLADILNRLARYDESIVIARKASQLYPQTPEAFNALGVALLRMGRGQAAIEALSTALELKPDFVEALHNLGSAYKVHGDFEAAERTFRKTLKLDAAYAPTLRQLTLCRRYKTTDTPEHEAMLHALSATDSNSKKAHLHFGLGKIYDDCKLYDQAFGHYQTANELHRASLEYDSERWDEAVDRIISRFDTEFFEQRSDWGVPDETPVFVFGMPRSGTTLIEQIVASHPLVYGAGELPTIGRIVRDLEQSEPLAEGQGSVEFAAKLDATAVERIAEDYLKVLREDVDSHVTRVTDKMPLNFVYLGLIAVVFPRASLIHCQRDPLDTCLSNYFQLFARRNEYAYDFEELADMYAGYVRLMTHWKAILPVEILDVHYEDVTRDLPTQARRLIEHVGLEWDDACVEYHKNKRDVMTASSWQVRQPLYRSSVERWRRYEKHIQPLVQRLADRGVVTGS